MLDAVRWKLEALYAGGAHRGTDGKLYTVDPNAMVPWPIAEEIAELHRSLRPKHSVEVGFAYGCSTLFILSAMQEERYGRHIAIDPYQSDRWHGIGLQAVKDAGLAGYFPRRFRWVRERSSYALATMARAGKRIQFCYIDGSHLFDDKLSDFCLSDQLLDEGGVVIIDDTWMPAVKRLSTFITANMTWYERFDLRAENLVGYRKIGRDRRPWNHFVDF
jgi:predicted O-methyltransferase YrrM